MTESSLTSHTKAPFSRRTKKTVPKPPMELIPHDVEEEEMLRDLYKRSSSRKRRKTDFYVSTPGGAENNEGGELGSGRGRREKAVEPVRRKLFSRQPMTPLVVSPPDTSGTAVVHMVEREDGPRETECPEDLVLAGDKKTKKPSLEDSHHDSPPTSPATCPSSVATTTDESKSPAALDVEEYPIGSMVWGRLPGYDAWPGVVISYCGGKEGDGVEEGEGGGIQVWVKWYGENNLSQIPADKISLFSNFNQNFKAHSLKGIYKKGVFTALKEAARRCEFEFASPSEDKTPRWMITNGCSEPTPMTRGEGEGAGEGDGEGEGEGDGGKQGEGVKQGEGEEGRGKEDARGNVSKSGKNGEKPTGEEDKGFKEDFTTPNEKLALAIQRGDVSGPKPGGGKRRRKARRGDKGRILLNSLEQEMLYWAQNGFLPAGPRGLVPTSEQRVVMKVIPIQSGGGRRDEEGRRGKVGGGEGVEEDEPPKKKGKVMLLQVRKKAHFGSVREGKMAISDLCIACGSIDVLTEHPLFEGGLCRECKDVFLECTYLFDDDGTQMYCCICSAGDEVFMCDAENCAKVYCAPCIEKLCGSSELEKVKAAGQWCCYMCSPDTHSVGLLTRRHDWDLKLQELFLIDNETEYESPPTYPPISPECRKPIRVLGLFDGIGTGLLVLKDLGIELDKYVASEIDQDAIKVSRVWHHEIFHVGDISKITEREIHTLGPFDLVIGGSPCNDLSIVNPARKGIYEGTGRLFFEFFRILSYVRLANDARPLFWLYENVVSMRAQDKQTISRFLQCNPVVVDAKDISPTHRARYFWGNIPGMNRATTPLPGDRLTLQDCLEPNCSRFAQFNKLRTITTKMNSIKQTKAAIPPVRMAPLMGGMEQSQIPQEEMQGDVLWCTEMERLFGFPDHYTDVANLGRSGRQRLLGKAWSVPVLRHLLSPLKDYFRSNTTRKNKQTTTGQSP